MGCWNISDSLRAIAFTLVPEIETWSSAANQYIIMNVFTMLWTWILAIILIVFYTHTVLSSQVNSSVLGGISVAVNQELHYLFNSQSTYIRQNFRHVVKAADYYVSPVYGYLQTLIGKADLDSDSYSSMKYVTWFLEILLFLVTVKLLILVWSLVGKL